MSNKQDLALRKKIAEALLRARKIVTEHKSEYKGVYHASGGGGTTQSNTSTTVPPEVLAEYQQVTNQANQVAATPLQQYSGQIVANQNQTETSAYNTINNMQGITAPYTAEANGLLGQASQTINPQTVTAQQIQNYESPYTGQVLNSTIAEENNQDAQQQAQLQGSAISSGAWGGDRSAVAQGILGGQQALANNATNAGILNQGYSQALQEANTQQQAGLGAQEASQYLQESAGLGENQLGTSALSNGIAGANAQFASGQQQQQQAQAELNVPYEQFLQQQAYPFQTTGWLGNIAEGIGSNSGGQSTSTTTQPSQGLFSDERLKENIKKVGILSTDKGDYPAYTYNYKGDNTPQFGVIAQEVDKKNPEAVHEDKSGYLKVNYNKLARGGIVARRDDGGGITPLTQGVSQNSSPFQKNTNSNYSGMSVQQLQQLAQRIPPGTMQGQAIQSALKQKEFLPNVGSGISGGMARGGIVPHYDGGGGTAETIDPGAEARADTIDSGAGARADTSGDIMSLFPEPAGGGVPALNPDRYNPDTQVAGNNTPVNNASPMPAPTPPVNAPDHPINTPPNYETEMPQTHQANPWLSVAAGVLGTLAGRSRNPLIDIGQGGLIGLNNYAQQTKAAQEQNFQEGSFHQNAQKLMQEAKDTQERFAQEKLAESDTNQYRQGQLALQQRELGLKQQEASKPVFDKAGNPWQLNPATGNYEKMSGTLGSDENIYGYKIGTIPEGTSAPVLDSKYDPTISMPATQKAIYNTKLQAQLEKDNAAAAINNDAIARLQASKKLTANADTGGITNMLGMGPIATAFDTQRQEIEGLNKELALAPGERPQGMRLTQGEVMMLKQAQPGTDKSPEANANIADAAIAIRQRPAEFVQFKNDFVANNGYWNDAVGQQMYNQYAKDNPIFDPKAISDPTSKERKIFALNPNRQTMEQYANSGKFAKYGVAGSPTSVTTPAVPAAPKAIHFNDLPQ